MGKSLPYVPLSFSVLSGGPLIDNVVVRMLSTPIRKCAQSSRYLPTGTSPLLYASTRPTDQSIHSDFLIRLSVKRLPPGSKRPMYTLVPDGVQHPKFKGLDSRKGHYVVCRRTAMQVLDKRGTAFSFLSLPAFKKKRR